MDVCELREWAAAGALKHVLAGARACAQRDMAQRHLRLFLHVVPQWRMPVHGRPCSVVWHPLVDQHVAIDKVTDGLSLQHVD